MKRKYRVILLGMLLCFWMGLIFYFSSQNGEASSETSGRLVKTVIAVLKPDFYSLEKSEQESFENLITFIIRKGAHFSEYMILGVLLFAFCWQWRPKLFLKDKAAKEKVSISDISWQRIWLVSWIIGTLYAASDEIHQVFSGGRSPQLRDVCIDSAGAAFGCLIVWLFAMMLKKCRKESENFC